MKLPFFSSNQSRIAKQALKELGLELELDGAYGCKVYAGAETRNETNCFKSVSPIDSKDVATVRCADLTAYEAVIADCQKTFLAWRQQPAPKRAAIVREIGDAFRQYKEPLAQLVSLETGKLIEEGRGEIQEAIDMADFVQGLGRQLYGLVLQSERPEHRMIEQWHPLGIIGVISAFNYPVAVWSWNAFLGAVCGNVILWKPSDLAPISSIAANLLARRVAAKYGFEAVFSLLISEGRELGALIAADARVPLVSATGSVAMGKSVAQTVAGRMGRSLLELGGNNAAIVMDDADLDLALDAILFGAVGTAGQRCTTIRRIIVHKAVEEEFTKRLIAAYKKLRIGNPLEDGIQVGPVKGARAISIFNEALAKISAQSGQVLCGGKVVESQEGGFYVEPTLVRASASMPVVAEENFVPIAYIISVASLEEAIAVQNSVTQGLSSAIFTSSLANSEKFLSAEGSDCGIANVNLGTSGAEIGGAFGGEKDTGGGREAGSDCWKNYMRRQTCTINYGKTHVRAQGVKFES